MLICWHWSFLWEYITFIIKFSSGRFFRSKMEFLVRIIAGRNTQEARLSTEHSQASCIPSTWLNYGASSSSAIWLLFTWSWPILVILFQHHFLVLLPAPRRSRKCKAMDRKHLLTVQLYFPGSIPKWVLASSRRSTKEQPLCQQQLSPTQHDLREDVWPYLPSPPCAGTHHINRKHLW